MKNRFGKANLRSYLKFFIFYERLIFFINYNHKLYKNVFITPHNCHMAERGEIGGKMHSGAYSSKHECLLCGDNMNVCTHCYCYEVNKLFQNYPRLAEEFVEFFNFELRGSSRVAVI